MNNSLQYAPTGVSAALTAKTAAYERAMKANKPNMAGLYKNVLGKTPNAALDSTQQQREVEKAIGMILPDEDALGILHLLPPDEEDSEDSGEPRHMVLRDLWKCCDSSITSGYVQEDMVKVKEGCNC